MTKVHPVMVIEIDPTKRRAEVLDNSLRDIRHNDAMSPGPVLQLGDAQVDESKLAELCKQYGVLELSLFGSAVRNEMRPESDVDLMVVLDPEAHIGLFRFMALSEEFETLIGRKVDLVTKRGLKPYLRSRILAEARVIYAA